MHVGIQVNPRNLSNAAENPTYGFKVIVRYIRNLASLDAKLTDHLSLLAAGIVDTYVRPVAILWPLRDAPPLHVHISYTYTGLPLPSGSYSSQAHIAVTDTIWTPMIMNALGTSIKVDYFQGNSEDLIVISEP